MNTMWGTALFYVISATLIVLITADGQYIESVAASIDAVQPSTGKIDFVPLVAFQCGFRNKYLSKESGKWETDTDRYATCMSSKYDILKYCRKAYPKMDVTNVVEYAHTMTIQDWCREEGTPCKWTHNVQPYRCVVGEFHNEALHVPAQCRFGHVDERQSCEEFPHWQTTAQDECGRHLGADGRTMRVHSFAVLQPCGGVGKFSSVEFVCCPQTSEEGATTKAPIMAATTTDKPPSLLLTDKTNKASAIQETVFDRADALKEDDDSSADEDDEKFFSENKKKEEEDDEDDDEYSDEDDEILMDELKKEKEATNAKRGRKASTTTTTTTTTATTTTTQAPELLGADGQDDPYFRLADPEREHEMYQAAVRRLEAKHHARVVQVMKDWAESENRYEKLKTTDPRQAEKYKAETKENFHRTVAALDTEIQDQRAQIDEVHQERVQARLNEKKRDAIRHYRDTLAAAIADPKPHEVLTALQSYIRAEEKDRVHSLNRYNHLLKSSPAQATSERPTLLRRLHDIDLRINGTIAMLHDFPSMVDKVKPAALQFWSEYRLANTPFTTDSIAVSLGIEGKDERILSLYEQRIRGELGDVIEDVVGSADSEQVQQIAPELVEKLELDKGVGPVLNVGDNFDDDELHQSHASQDRLVAEHVGFEHSEDDGHDHSKRALSTLTLTCGALIMAVVIVGVVLVRRRGSRARQGFIEVDLYTPEERQLAAMQQNGYENPTYSHFEKV